MSVDGAGDGGGRHGDGGGRAEEGNAPGKLTYAGVGNDAEVPAHVGGAGSWCRLR